MLRLLAALFAALRSLRLAIPFISCALPSCCTIQCLHAVPERSELSARVLMSIPENAPKEWKQQDLPGSWVTHICICPVLRPRRDRSCQAITACRFYPHLCDSKGSHNECTFEALSHGFCNRCLRFAAWVAPGPRKTHFWLLARLCQTGLSTRRVTPKGFRSTYISSSSPRLILARRKPAPSGGYRVVCLREYVVIQWVKLGIC
jgi:hypothetical protein